jgi:NADH:ubiquinone oxidoreductase subunit E
MNNELYSKLKAVIDEKKSLRNPLIEILRTAQEIFGYLPVEVQEFIANEMGVPASKVYGVVTFYKLFLHDPSRQIYANVCTGTACYVKGAPRLIQMLSDHLGIGMGETTEDGLFTMSAVRCVGACSLAPVFVIGEDTFGRHREQGQKAQILKRYN